jgi:HAD superfamily hydrolase (TIGR01509 family)
LKSRSKPELVVFDFDGTLVNSLPLVLASIAHALEPFGARPTMDIFAHLGGPPERFLPQLLANPANVPAALERMNAYHQNNNHLVEVFEGAVATLDMLESSGVQAAIWTGRDRASAEVLMAELGLEGRFREVMCGDDLASHKPDPAGLREIMRRLGVAPRDTLYVGDADVDVLGGCACGVDTILIRHARRIGDDVAARCWESVESPAEAYSVVTRCVSGA